MASEHWFDELHRTLTAEAPRRGLLHAASTLMAGLALRSSSQRAMAKKQRKRNEKGKKKGKGHNSGSRQPNQCGAAICDQEFAGAEVGECMAKCDRCRLEDRFCVIEGDPLDPTKIATCCFEDQQCCQDTFACCPQDHTCCGGYPERIRPCCPPNMFCCDSSAEGCCEDSEACCPGAGCVNLEADPHNCGACDTPCIPGERCVGSTCVHHCDGNGPFPQPCRHDTGDGPFMDCIGARDACCDGFSCPFPFQCCDKTCSTVEGECL